MTCRARTTGAVEADKHDPKGVCLDDTASGPFLSATDGGVTDGGVVPGG